jgi:hypothetical protein
MNVDPRTLRPYAPLLVLIATVGLGWLVFVRPVVAERARAATQIDGLRQREMVLRRELGAPAFAPSATAGRPSPRVAVTDPVAAFERQVAAGDASPALLEQLARLASAARARNLLIETAEAGAVVGRGAPPQVSQRDPRFGLFDVPVSHAPIRLAFDTDYASVGRFLWALRDLPTTVEIRALSVGLPPAASDDDAPSTRSDALRMSLTLHAYSRSSPGVIRASSTVAR